MGRSLVGLFGASMQGGSVNGSFPIREVDLSQVICARHRLVQAPAGKRFRPVSRRISEGHRHPTRRAYLVDLDHVERGAHFPAPD